VAPLQRIKHYRIPQPSHRLPRSLTLSPKCLIFPSQNRLTFLFARASHLRSSSPNAGFWCCGSLVSLSSGEESAEGKAPSGTSSIPPFLCLCRS
ncbi:unnamed protein product, partial [Musa acuminata var. zebrina]